MNFLQTTLLTAFVLVTLVSGRIINEKDVGHVMVEDSAKYLIQLSPDTQHWVTEEEKWELIHVCLSKLSCLYMVLSALRWYFIAHISSPYRMEKHS